MWDWSSTASKWAANPAMRSAQLQFLSCPVRLPVSVFVRLHPCVCVCVLRFLLPGMCLSLPLARRNGRPRIQKRATWRTDISGSGEFTAHTGRSSSFCPRKSTAIQAGQSARNLTSVKSNLAKGRITALSPLAEANAFVHHVRWTGTFASGGRRTTRNAVMCSYVTRYSGPAHMSLQMCPFSWGSRFPSDIIWFLGLKSLPRKRNGISIGSVVLHSSPVCPHTHTHTHIDSKTQTDTNRHADHATCDICSNRLHLCTACRRKRIRKSRGASVPT